jgi:hypothetical protein
MRRSVEDMTTDAAAQDGSRELEATLDEVITHLREELHHGDWPASPSVVR